jgi:hypothetical protein
MRMALEAAVCPPGFLAGTREGCAPGGALPRAQPGPERSGGTRPNPDVLSL